MERWCRGVKKFDAQVGLYGVGDENGLPPSFVKLLSVHVSFKGCFVRSRNSLVLVHANFKCFESLYIDRYIILFPNFSSTIIGWVSDSFIYYMLTFSRISPYIEEYIYVYIAIWSSICLNLLDEVILF